MKTILYIAAFFLVPLLVWRKDDSAFNGLVLTVWIAIFLAIAYFKEQNKK